MRNDAPTVLMCYAHPDDETFGCGGTTAVLSGRGVSVHVLLATRGQAGQINDPDLATPEGRASLGEVREAEARAAAAAVGAAEVVFLDYVDGTMADADPAIMARKVAAEIRRVRPDVLVTFGPEGIYGHPDHVAIHGAATDAVALAAEPAVALGDTRTHVVKRLFYQVIRAELAAALNERQGPVVLDGRPYPFVGYADEAITTRVDISPVWERKLEALRCHRTQTAGRMEELRERLASQPLEEHFVLARSVVPDHPALRHDLLAGIA